MSNVLIFSREDDITTDRVIEWVTAFGYTAIRINNEYFLNNPPRAIKIEAGAGNWSISLSGKKLAPNEIQSVYIRKGGVKTFQPKTGEKVNPDSITEVEHGINAVRELLRDKILVGRPESDHNKIQQLNIAMQCGLDIPDTLITSDKKDLVDFFEKHDQVITKAINMLTPVVKRDKIKIFYTSTVNREVLKKLPKTFIPSLFQQYIHKQYELRIFYLSGQLYSMAIFSQQNLQTAIDFRDYSLENPNRTVPYRLPEDISEKIVRLMDALGLNTGSIDMIRATDGRYYFLEVNQSGQLGMVSAPCNYQLEKEIASVLVSKSKHR